MPALLAQQLDCKKKTICILSTDNKELISGEELPSKTLSISALPTQQMLAKEDKCQSIMAANSSIMSLFLPT
jgi:hypothetical protein